MSGESEGLWSVQSWPN